MSSKTDDSMRHPLEQKQECNKPSQPQQSQLSGWTAVLGCTYESLQWFRVVLGCFLTLELMLRYRVLTPFYTDIGTLPTPLVLAKVDSLYQLVCFHCHFGLLWQQQLLLTIQVILSILWTLGYGETRYIALLSWYMYFSLTLRNTWLNYILDRYLHYLLFLSIFLPLHHHRRPSPTSAPTTGNIVISPATIAFKLLVIWIYVDAGYGKYADPLHGWSYDADPLPALDTYARHTIVAQYMYALLKPHGLRIMTPIVVYVELLAAPVALLGRYIGSKRMIYTAVTLIVSLHVGIALTLRNAALLSFVACTAWIPFLPLGGGGRDTSHVSNNHKHSQNGSGIARWRRDDTLSVLCVGAMIIGNVWFETTGCDINSPVQTIWSTLLHNRWNVFIGAEEYVTWEIAPGLLSDGSIVDIWGRRETVDWRLPGSGAPCTATARPGRWRSFPYLAELQGDDADALWGYLCREWDNDHPNRTLVKYNFFMLQADVLPNMTFSATRKRLIQSYDCTMSQDPTLSLWPEAEQQELSQATGQEL